MKNLPLKVVISFTLLFLYYKRESVRFFISNHEIHRPDRREISETWGQKRNARPIESEASRQSEGMGTNPKKILLILFYEAWSLWGP